MRQEVRDGREETGDRRYETGGKRHEIREGKTMREKIGERR